MTQRYAVEGPVTLRVMSLGVRYMEFHPLPTPMSSLIWHLHFRIRNKRGRTKWSPMSMVALALRDPTASRSPAEVNSPHCLLPSRLRDRRACSEPTEERLSCHGTSSTLSEAKGRQGISSSEGPWSHDIIPWLPNYPLAATVRPCPPPHPPTGF